MSGIDGPIRVLYVDGEPDLVDVATTFLTRNHDCFTTETATSVSEGLERLSEGEFDCVVSDYDMPDQDGIAFLQAVRESHPDLPFILYTSKGSEGVASEAISAGVTDYLQKGDGTDQYALLANRIQNAVERREAKRERKRHLQAIQTANEGISILDEDGHYVFVNQAFADLHGYGPERLIGEHWELVYRDEDVPEVRTEILPEVRQRGYWHGETTSLRADGSTVIVDHTLSMTEQGEIVCSVQDTSEQKERERELREKTARLEALFEHSPDMIKLHDADGSVTDLNPRLCKKTGYDAAELTDMKIWELNQGMDSAEAYALWESMDVGDRRRLESVYQCRDGSTLPVEVHLRRLRFEGQDRFISIARDISERKERKRRLDGLIETLPIGYVRTSLDEEFLDMNSTFVGMVGGESAEEIKGHSVLEFYQDETTRERLLNTLREEGAVEGEQLKVTTLQGETRWVTVTGRLVEADGEPRIDALVQDITERKEYERELATEREFTTQMLNAIDDIVYMYSPDGTLERWNDRLSEVTGYTDEELDGKMPTEFFPGDEQPRAADAVEELVTTGNVTFEGDLLTAEGERIPHEFLGTKMTDSDGTVLGLVGVARDVSGRKRRERELRRENERLEQFASVVSHDLRNPLSVADASLQLVKKECDSEHLERIEGALDRMDALIEDVLALAREGESVREVEPVDLAAVVDSCWANVETADAALVADVDRTIHADGGRLKRVFENLVRNAIEHGGEDVIITVGELDDGFYVEDDGPGIPEDEREEVFDAGYSTDRTGTGFGLSIVEQIVEAHNWEISVSESSTGGARFEITGAETGAAR